MKILDHGFVRLDAHMADDLSVVNAARISLHKHKDEIDKSDTGLINFLMSNRHGTPFEHNAFRWHIKAPIFVAREWFRHRIGSFNEVSGRYTELTEEFYVPDFVRTQVGKPGAYVFETVGPAIREETRAIILLQCQQAFEAYREMLDMGVAKEVARLVLPVNTYTEFYWTVNARSLMNFLSLRTPETAQYEIRQFADEVENLFSDRMPLTYAAWIKNNKISP